MRLQEDISSPIRAGEELNVRALEGFLVSAIADIELPVSIEQFPHGHSNLTYLLLAGAREMVLRRPPFGTTVKSAHDMRREFTVLSHLSSVYPPAPKPLAYCPDESVMGAPFYLMERMIGTILRARRPEGLTIDPAQVSACCDSFVRNLADLHQLDFRTIGLEELYRGTGYVERQGSGWGQRYKGSQTDDIQDVDKLVEWLSVRIPIDSGSALIHNDYKFDNLVLNPANISSIVGVLDWEMSTVGDPLADLGTSLAYWIEPGDGDQSVVQCFLTMEPGAMTRRRMAERYAELTGRDIDNILFYYVLALPKLAVILQQIYSRYKQGLTRDERFAGMIGMVRQIAKKAVIAIDVGHI